MTNIKSNGSKERMDERLERMHEIECRICTFNIDGVCKLDGEYIPKIGCVGGKAKPMTNADRIRAMSDEELTEWLTNFSSSNVTPYATARGEMYRGRLLNWLKEEAKGESDE